MKTYLKNILILLLILGAYYIDFFNWFTGKGALFSAILLVCVMLVIGWFVIGNPFAEEKHHDEDK